MVAIDVIDTTIDTTIDQRSSNELQEIYNFRDNLGLCLISAFQVIHI